MIEKQIVVKDQLLNYYFWEAKKQTATSVIFLHGWRVNGMIWLPVVKLLTEGFFVRPGRTQNDTNNNYNIYCLDLPGFGKSEFPQKPFHLKNYAEVVREFIEKLTLSSSSSPVQGEEGRGASTCLVGHSFGGRVAVKLAVEFPGIIQKLVLVDCGGFRKSEWKRGFITFLAKVIKPAFSLPLLRAWRPTVYNILGADDYLAIPELKSTFLNIINEDLSELFPKIQHPTLIIWGEVDQEAPLEYGKFIHSKIQNSIFYILRGAGHFVFLDNPQDFVKELNSFLNEPL